MYGYDTGTLNVYLKTNTYNQLLWSLTGQVGFDWFQGIAPFKSRDMHQIMFEGIVGKGDR